MLLIASRVSFSTLAATVTIANGLPITVYGMIITNATASADLITLTNAAGTTIGAFSLLATTSIVLNVPFAADGGLKISAGTPSASTAVTVFHSQSSS